MTPSTDWAPAVIVLVAALGVGVVVLLQSRRGAALPAPTRARRTELLQQKDSLYTLLREHARLREAAADPAAWSAERDRLEQDAARVLQALDQLGEDAPPVPAERQGFGQRNPRLVGAMWGAGTVLFFGGLALLLQDATKARPEGGSITGGGGMGAQGADAQASADPALQARLDALRAAVDAAPQDIDARNRLGHALLHAGLVMDSLQQAEAVQQLRADDPESRTHQAIAFLAIGDTTRAATTLDAVLVTAPNLAEALAYRGALHYRAGESAEAIALLERAATADPSLAPTVQPLIDEARNGGAPGAMAASAAPQAAPTEAAAPSAEDITGTIALDPSIADKVKPGDVLFVSARPPDVERGPPTWVLRMQAGSFPMDFRIGPANAMLGGATPSSLVITARIDRDGNAMTRSPDDLEAKSAPTSPGTQGTTLTLAATR